MGWPEKPSTGELQSTIEHTFSLGTLWWRRFCLVISGWQLQLFYCLCVTGMLAKNQWHPNCTFFYPVGLILLVLCPLG